MSFNAPKTVEMGIVNVINLHEHEITSTQHSLLGSDANYFTGGRWEWILFDNGAIIYSLASTDIGEPSIQ